MPNSGGMSTPRYRGRFAPSPTGPLHLGSLVAALGSWLFARQASGTWLIRMEDLDPPREVPGAARQQLATLSAFGFEADGPVLFQSQRHEAYAEALRRLIEAGQAFACRCSRSDLEASQGRHLGGCVNADPLRPTAVRLRVPEQAIEFVDRVQGRIRQNLRQEVGDVVLRRADGLWAYQLAVVLDDASQGITDIVRGADLLDSTPRQIWLQRCLGLPQPNYTHLPLMLDDHGRKLSKSLASLPVDGQDPLPALQAAWRFLGQIAWSPGMPCSPERWLQQALARFEPGRIPRQSSPARPQPG